MGNIWQRIVEDLFTRLDGPLHFWFIVQPLTAVIFSIIRLGLYLEFIAGFIREKCLSWR